MDNDFIEDNRERTLLEVYKDPRAGYVIFTHSNTPYPLLETVRKYLVKGR